MPSDLTNAARLGRSGLFVSPLCLGTMTFGTEADAATSRSIMDLAFDAGVFFWDTADMYGRGASEELVGQGLRGRRDRIVLATKAYAPMADHPNRRGLSARNLIAACEDSLRRLGTDWIDLYYLHVPDPGTPIEESLRAMEDLVRSGKVRYVGASNYRAWQYADMVHLARSHGWQPIDAIQPLYNLVNRDAEVELLPMADHFGLGVVTYSPLARGVLTGKYSWQGPPPARSRLADGNPRLLRAEWRRESVEVADRLAELARARGTTAAQLALRWVLANQAVHSVIMGARDLDQARAALDARLLPWDDELEAACDALVPPGSHTGRGWQDDQYYPVLGRRVGR